MTISELIAHLEAMREQHGDIPVDGGTDCFIIERREYGGGIFLKVRDPLVIEQG